MQCRDEGLRRQRNRGRRHAAFGKRALENAGEAGRGVDEKLGDERARGGIEAGGRIDDAAMNVVVGDELLVIAVGRLRPAADHLFQPGCARRHRDLDLRKPLAPEPCELVIGAADAPFGGAVDRVLGLGLRGVKGLDRVGVVVAQDAGRVGGIIPSLAAQRLEQPAVPLLRLFRRAAPIAVADVQNVVLEVLELLVRRLGAFEIDLGVLEEEVLPALGVGPSHEAQRIERELVMRAVGVGGVDDAVKKAHAGTPCSGAFAADAR